MISIAMAAYNGEKYIREQIDSILAQTYQDFELIVCDDCSTDSTWGIIQEYEQRDGRIHGCRNDANLGFKKNFEKAIGLCRGEYTALSDQDDMWTRDHLETLLDAIGDGIVCCGDAALVNKEGRDLHCTFSSLVGDYSLINTAEKQLIRLLYYSNAYQGSTMLVRADALRRMLPIPDEVHYHDYWIAGCAAAFDGIRYTTKVVIKYRQHENNVTGNYQRTLWQRITNRIHNRGGNCDGTYFCETLLKRCGNEIDFHKYQLLESAKAYFENRRSGWLYRLQELPFFVRNARYMYLTRSRRMLFIRLIQYLFF